MFSFGALYLETLSEEGAVLARATGFTAYGLSGVFLVTNRHVVRGRHQDTDEFLDPKVATPPSGVRAYFRTGDVSKVLPVEISLFDGSGLARWVEHPTLGRRVDVVGISLGDIDTAVEMFSLDLTRTNPTNAPGGCVDQLDFDLGDGVIVTGFPFGLRAPEYRAIWARGSVASHPADDFDQLPRFLIDSRTREGQSGSPVFFHSPYGSWRSIAGDTCEGDGPAAMLVGIYSGRVNDQSDLGYVWGPGVIAEVLNGDPPSVDIYDNPPLPRERA